MAGRNDHKDETDYISYDAPPLDFSFKNIKSIEQLKSIQPRQGEKKKTGLDDHGKIQDEKQDDKTGEVEDQHRGDKKNEATRLLPLNNINSIVASLVTTSAMKNISMKAKEQLQKKKKKAIYVKLICSALMLSYNKLRQLNGLTGVLSTIMDDFRDLQWIDLSHNYIVNLDCDFKEFSKLKTIYLHCNYIANFNELEKLNPRETLKSFTIHGNPLTAVSSFRLIVISILPQLKKLDSVLISKKQTDNASYIRDHSKKQKYPILKNHPMPPVEKKQDEEEEKE